MTALGNDKIILTIKNKTYDRNSKTTTLTGHLLFYKKENGSWNLKKELMLLKMELLILILGIYPMRYYFH